MILVVDCFKLVKGKGKSIGIYNLTLNLVRNLVRYRDHMENHLAKKCRVIVLGNQYNEQDFNIDGVDFVLEKLNPLNRFICIFWELFWVQVICIKLKADRVFFPRGFCAVFHPVKDTIIIHDMIPFYYHRVYPHMINKLENFYIRWRLKASIRSCRQIITISNESKREILSYVNINEDKIATLYTGCNSINHHGSGKDDYIVAVTSELPHKNAKGIVDAYKEYCRITPNPLRLVVIGVKDVDSYSLTENIKEKISCIKYIGNNTEFYQIVARARIFLFLSLKEGFGFPPIEAMQLGVPVICSNVSSIPEVVGKAAVLVDPMNPTKVAEEIHSLEQDPNRQAILVEEGYKNIQRFSWDEIIKSYGRVLFQ